MRLVDTNVVTYLLIAGDHTAAAQALWRIDPEWHSEAFFRIDRIEFSNLLATQVRAKALTLADALALLERCAATVASVVEVSDADALRVASAHGVSAYDGRFLAAALASGAKLVTEDSRLRRQRPSSRNRWRRRWPVDRSVRPARGTDQVAFGVGSKWQTCGGKLVSRLVITGESDEHVAGPGRQGAVQRIPRALPGGGAADRD
jgi:predicted nucleic acid-binding protein